MTLPSGTPAMAVPAAAMFDMDGVLIQSRDVIERGWRTAAQDHGITVTERDVRDHIHGRPGTHTLETLFGRLSAEQRRAVKRQVDAMEEVADCALTDGVAALLDELAAARVPIALVTSSWPARIAHVLRQHRLVEHFQVIIHRDDVTAGKPSSECYLLAAHRLGVSPRACVVFEDSQSGVAAAVGSGASCVGIGDDAGLLASGARALRASFAGLRVADLVAYLR